MGKIELDHTGSGGGITLSSDGTSLLLGGTAIGGSALELYAENPSTPTAPSATGANAVAIGTNAVASNADSVSIGSYSDATGSGAIALGTVAQAVATRSAAVGKSYAGGVDSFAGGIGYNTSAYGTGGSGAVALGLQSKASAAYSSAMGRSNVASNTGALALGYGSTASGTESVAIGYVNTASQQDSFAIGRYALSNIIGKLAHGSGRFAATGDAQGGQFILRAATTDATATVLTTNNSTAASTNQIVAASDTCITFDGTITAMQNGAQAYASWKIEGLLVNDGGTTTLANSTTTVISNGSSWGMALSADNTNNALAITVTGAASTNIRWVANIRTTEVTYA